MKEEKKMLDIIRSAARVLMLILSGDLDPVPIPVSVPDAPGDPVPVVPVLASNQII